MTTPIIRSISGIRGLVKDSMNAFEAYKTTLAYYEVYLKRFARHGRKQLVIIGKDPKASGRELVRGTLAALKDINRFYKTGLAPYYLGVTSSPLLEWAVLDLKAVGGINFTASHNPIEWNGIKLITHHTEHAVLLNAGQMRRINRRLARLDTRQSAGDRQRINRAIRAVRLPAPRTAVIKRYHRDVIGKVSQVIDACAGVKGTGRRLWGRIKNRPPRVVIDGCSGDGGALMISFLRQAGISHRRIIMINTGPIEKSCRRLEPAPPYLGSLRQALGRYQADIGFAVDPDQDRLVCLPLQSEEHSPLLAAKFLFELQQDNKVKYIRQACVNLSTTAAWEDVAGPLGVRIVRTKIGELNVAAGMMRHRTVLGAEGNGGVLLGPVNYGRNSTVAMALLLCYCAHTGKTIGQLAQGLPGYVLVKDKMQVPDPARALSRIASHFRKQRSVRKIDSRDGYKVLFRDRSWLQVRASNTEPIVRIFAETRIDKSTLAAGKNALGLVSTAKKIMAGRR